MMNLKMRLKRLEQASIAENRYFVFAGDDETSEAAILKRFPGGLPEGAAVTVLCWETKTTSGSKA
ncbi:MAG: hypothetical protein JSS43_21080 [Proteobacteria bacterium]|nr:hypothetical protein [Pseudomonadota bacterium]